MVSLKCLKTHVSTGGRVFPIFVGFLPAEDILKVASAPSFDVGAPHQAIADNVLRPPVEEWQRPLDDLRVTAISNVFSDVGNLMPNPVLLSENVNSHTTIPAHQETAVHGVPTNIWVVEIPEPSTGSPYPLWILDGQHRINGLARSAQSSNNVPLVLLLNEGVASYTGGLLAKIFAQVTTSATELDVLHNEWLTFAFELEDYDPARRSDANEQRRAMQTVAEACRLANVDASGTPNAFFNRVAFNVHLATPSDPAFFYNCVELQDLIRRHYFSRAANAGHLRPEEVAKQLGLAIAALRSSIPAPHSDSVFFGDPDHEQGYMQDGFIAGVLTFLLEHGAPTDWAAELDNLEFPRTDWNFRSWVTTLHGGTATTSKKMAINVMSSVFRARSLPSGSRNLAEFLRGNDATVTVQFSEVTARGRASRVGRREVHLKSGARLTELITPRRHIKLAKITENIGSVRVLDQTPVRGEPVEYPVRRGMVLDSGTTPNPLNLVVTMLHYGGNRSVAELTVRW